MNTASGYFPAMIFVGLLTILWLAFTAYEIIQGEDSKCSLLIYYSADGDWELYETPQTIGVLEVFPNSNNSFIQSAVNTALAEQEHQL